ncbi:DUF1659 domain-containing protein [Metabacillus herbersteinensis]|uniref:DUF1659 domain-containing protein n=1 Tax=Metabacillus herbersteinensis TaxID=283816 RepID=A0ABV6GE98_9BACI
MAEAYLLDSQLRLVYNVGIDEEGKAILKSKNYNNVKTTATAEQLLQAAQAIASLQTETLEAVERNDSQQLTA